MSLATALELLSGPGAHEDWSAWRMRSLEFVAQHSRPDAVSTLISRAVAGHDSHAAGRPVCSQCADVLVREIADNLAEARTLLAEWVADGYGTPISLLERMHAFLERTK